MPQLAFLMDSRYESNYAAVYTLSQTAVCLAYLFGPLFAGQLAPSLGFPMVMKLYVIWIAFYATICMIFYRSLCTNTLNNIGFTWFCSDSIKQVCSYNSKNEINIK